MRFVGLPHQDEAFQEVIKGRETDPESTYAELEELGKISPAFDLLPGDAYRVLIISFLDQPGKLRRTGHVGPLADHDIYAGLLGKRL